MGQAQPAEEGEDDASPALQVEWYLLRREALKKDVTHCADLKKRPIQCSPSSPVRFGPQHPHVSLRRPLFL
jgi:hypothetical protein